MSTVNVERTFFLVYVHNIFTCLQGVLIEWSKMHGSGLVASFRVGSGWRGFESLRRQILFALLEARLFFVLSLSSATLRRLELVRTRLDE